MKYATAYEAGYARGEGLEYVPSEVAEARNAPATRAIQIAREAVRNHIDEAYQDAAGRIEAIAKLDGCSVAEAEVYLIGLRAGALLALYRHIDNPKACTKCGESIADTQLPPDFVELCSGCADVDAPEADTATAERG